MIAETPTPIQIALYLLFLAGLIAFGVVRRRDYFTTRQIVIAIGTLFAIAGAVSLSTVANWYLSPRIEFTGRVVGITERGRRQPAKIVLADLNGNDQTVEIPDNMYHRIDYSQALDVTFTKWDGRAVAIRTVSGDQNATLSLSASQHAVKTIFEMYALCLAFSVTAMAIFLVIRRRNSEEAS
jgi:hypothetical protein